MKVVYHKSGPRPSVSELGNRTTSQVPQLTHKTCISYCHILQSNASVLDLGWPNILMFDRFKTESDCNACCWEQINRGFYSLYLCFYLNLYLYFYLICIWFLSQRGIPCMCASTLDSINFAFSDRFGFLEAASVVRELNDSGKCI